MNEVRISRYLIIGAMLVAAPRYIGVNAHAEGWLIAGPVWRWVVALSGLGMAVLEGVAVWYCWQKWGDAKPGQMRNVLLSLIAAMLIVFGFTIAPYTYAASEEHLVNFAVSDWLRVVWAVSVSIAPLIVMAASGLAEKIPSRNEQEAQGEAHGGQMVSQTVVGEITAVKTEFSQPKLKASPAAQLSAGETWQAQALSLARNQIETGAQPNYTQIAQAVGKSRTAVAAAVKAQLP